MAKAAKTTRPTYDAKKNYGWEPKDKFTISGQQFASLYHLMNQEVNSPGGATIIMKMEGYEVVMSMLRRGVERGKIKEAGIPATIQDLTERANDMFAVKNGIINMSEMEFPERVPEGASNPEINEEKQ